MATADESSIRYFGWLVVAVCFVVIAVASGARFAFGVLLDPLVDAFVAFLGVTLYATAPLTSPLTADLYGDTLLSSTYGWTGAIYHVGGAIGAAFAGYVYDTREVYDPAFVVRAALLVVGTVAIYAARELDGRTVTG